MIDLLRRVNAEINAGPYGPDLIFDDWRPGDPTKPRDCDSFQTAKQQALFDAGVPAGDMRLAYVKFGAEGHLLLVVNTPQGDYVMDNRAPQPISIMDLGLMGYEIVSIQEFGGSPDWVQWIGNEETKT